MHIGSELNLAGFGCCKPLLGSVGDHPGVCEAHSERNLRYSATVEATMKMPVVIPLFSIAVIFLSSCATWHEERSAARTLAEVQESLAKVPHCNGEQLASALTSVPVDAPGGTVVTLRGDIRIGLEEGRFAHCLGNELVGCAPYTGPWLLLPAAGGAEFVELYAAGGDEMGWVSREGAVKTLTQLPLANVIVTGKLGSPLQPEERARGGRRTINFGRMCKVDS